MNEELSFLQAGLANSFAKGVHAPETWVDLTGITRAHAQVLSQYSGADVTGDPRSIMSAITAFRKTGTVEGLRELKYVCLGVGAIDGRGWCVLADSELRRAVAGLVERQPELRRRFRCFQALLWSYWAFPLYDRSTSEEARAGWFELRSWLHSEWKRIVRTNEPKPPWFGCLTRYSELLTDKPCEKFGIALLGGDYSGLNDAINGLAIPTGSWVHTEAVFALVKAATGQGDPEFKALLPQLLAIAAGTSGVELGETLRVRCVAQLVSRYARCRERPEQMALRDAAVTTIGNPWVRRTNWDAFVVDANGKPDGQAREMVNGWLKRRLISDFFVLLTVDGTGDPRRLEYWLRFEPFVEDMWFALGRDAQARKGEHFDEFKASAKGRLLDLDDSPPDNNAFVMRIGRYLAVEFGAMGNAFRLFEWASLSPTLVNTLTSGRARARVSLDDLKASNWDQKLNHRDSAAETWEQKFDDRICPLLGRPNSLPRFIAPARTRAAQGPTPLEWIAFVRTHQLSVEDNRAKHGALWVLAEDLPRGVASKLRMWGFRQRPPRGWYKESQ